MILNDLSSLHVTDHRFLVLFFWFGYFTKNFSRKKNVRWRWVTGPSFFSDKALALLMIPRMGFEGKGSMSLKMSSSTLNMWPPTKISVENIMHISALQYVKLSSFKEMGPQATQNHSSEDKSCVPFGSYTPRAQHRSGPDENCWMHDCAHACFSGEDMPGVPTES